MFLDINSDSPTWESQILADFDEMNLDESHVFNLGSKKLITKSFFETLYVDE